MQVRHQDKEANMSANTDLVVSFCKEWSGRDIDKLMSYFTDDAIYHNIPVAPVQGKDGIRS